MKTYQMWTGRDWVSINPSDLPLGIQYVKVSEPEPIIQKSSIQIKDKGFVTKAQINDKIYEFNPPIKIKIGDDVGELVSERIKEDEQNPRIPGSTRKDEGGSHQKE